MKLGLIALFAVSAAAAARDVPLAFEETPAKNIFAVHRPGRTIAVQPDGIRVYARDSGARWQMRFKRARRTARAQPEDLLPGRVNYLLGANRQQWRRNLRCWRVVRYHGIYPGIDVAYYGNDQGIEYDLIVAPGADLGRVRLAFPGLSIAGVTAEGILRFDSESASIAQRPPVAYQDIDGKRQVIRVAYRVTSDGEVMFDVPQYDRTRPLVIDPVLVYSTYLGGNANDTATALTSDSQGNIYIAGGTQSPDYPTTPEAFSTTLTMGSDIFVTKLAPDGTLIYSTYLGDNQASAGAHAIAADSYGNAYVAGPTANLGVTTSSPVITPGALSGGAEFIVKLNAAGNSILYGARFPSAIRGMAADQAGDLYLTGEVSNSFYAPPMPITPGAYQQQASGQVGYVAKLNPAANRVRYCTYLGGGSDYPKAIAIDASGNAYVTGYTYSLAFPTMNPIQAQLAYQGFFRTSDGQSWSEGAMPDGRTLTALALDPTDGALYLGTANGLFKSTDGGSSWSQISLDGYSVISIATQNTARNILVAAYKPGGSSGTVFRSTDGTSFLDTGSGYAPQIIAIDPSNPAVVYTASGSSFQKSTDGGSHWTYPNNTDQFYLLYSLAVDPHNSNVYITSDRGFQVSTNGGQTFQMLSRITSNASPTVITFDPQDPNTIYLGSYFSLYKSTDGGHTFRNTPSPAPIIGSLAFDPNNSSTLYAATSSGVFKSADGAATWTPVNTGITNTNIAALVFDPSSGNHFYTFAYLPSDAFVTKLNATGTALIYSTYLGGLSSDTATGIVVDGGGNAFVGGYTSSVQFPTTANATQQANAGGSDGFIAQISPDGGSLLFSTYFGGRGNDSVSGLAIDSAGNVAIAGSTSSQDLAVSVSALQTKLAGPQDAFIAVLTPSAGSLRLAAYLGGSDVDSAAGVAAIAPGRFCIAGTTSSVDFPTTRGSYQPMRNGFNDTFVAIVDINR